YHLQPHLAAMSFGKALPCYSLAAALLASALPLTAADAPPPGAPGGVPNATAPTVPPGPGDAGARGGRGGGRGGRGGSPITPESQAAIARLADLPVWTRDSEVGDYSAGPGYPTPPENAPRDNVPKGRVDTFHI